MALPARPTKGQVNAFDTFDTWAAAVGSLADTAFPIKGNLGTQHLDTVVAEGTYFQHQAVNATLANGYPVAGGTCVASVARRADDNNLVQKIVLIGAMGSAGRGEFQRVRVSGAWQGWQFLPAQRVDTTAGRVFYTWDQVNNREQLTYGDTGWRDISLLFQNNWSGQAFIRRFGATVELILGTVNSAAATDYPFLAIPDGFKPRTPTGSWIIYPWMQQSVGASDPKFGWRSVSGAFVPASGIKPALATTYNAGVFQSVVYTTNDQWPAALPGVASGAIPST